MTTPLPLTDDGFVNCSAEFGVATIVVIEWNTDHDRRVIDPEKEQYPQSFYGPFVDEDEAMRWVTDYPDDTDVHDMYTSPLNNVRPA
jgi:hypothetical protein